MKYGILAIFTILLLATTACQQSLLGDLSGEPATDNQITNMFADNNGDLAENFAEENASNATAAVTLEPSRFAVTKTEGDLVILAPEAIDPDGDMVSYEFGAPFDANGEWQTTYGDAGEYTVMVKATDTKGASTTETVDVLILHANRPPFLHCPEKIVATEGETITIDCEVNDLEQEAVTLTYFGWMTDNTYTTTYEDAGTHEVTVVAKDESGQSTEATIAIVVHDANRAPIFPLDFPQELQGEEGDVFVIDTSEISDPDGDHVTVTFSSPFGSNGIWTSKIGDAGSYPVDVIASDGTASAKRTVRVDLAQINTAPVLERIPDITVYEGETIHLSVSATDRENDPLTTTVTGWMTSTNYTTTYDDAGTYTVKVTVSDGMHADSQVVHIIVIDRNRPPVFVVPG